MSPTSKPHVILRDGTAQEDRLLKALREGYINVDEMPFQDLLALAVDFSRMLRFYTLDNEPHGGWDDLFQSDVAVILAMISATDLNAVESDFLHVFLRTLRANHYNVGEIPAYQLATKVNSWFTYLKTTETPVGASLRVRIAALIETDLRDALGDLETFLVQEEPDIAQQFQQTFDPFWFLGRPRTDIGARAPSPSGSRLALERFLKKNFYSFYNAIQLLQESAAHLLPMSLKSESHSAAIGLFIAFVRLFRHAQDKINLFTQRHLRFYYRDVLQCEPRDVTADSTFLILQPDGQDRPVFVNQGTQFTAGTDEDGNPVFYTADNDLIVRATKVASLCTLFLEADPLSSPEHELNSISGAKVLHVPALNEAASVAAADMKPWPLFGAPRNDAAQQLLGDAELGFAIASPVLLLGEGLRDINISLKIGYPSQGDRRTIDDSLELLQRVLQTTKQDAFFKAFGRMFAIHLTTATGWHEVPDYLPLSAAVDKDCEQDCLQFKIRLSPDVPSVIAYAPEIHGEHYDTDLPIIRFLVNPSGYLYPYSLLKNLLLKEVQIAVDVMGVKDLQLYNNLGQLDSSAPFNPFGPVPSVGSYFIVGSPEAARKRLTHAELSLEWGDLPSQHGGFAEYYRAYDTPFRNEIFEVRVTTLSGGTWQPGEEKEQPRITLFESEAKDDRQDGADTVMKHRLLSCGPAVRYLKPVDGVTMAKGFGYSSQARDGFVKLTLSDPPYAFGHRDYASVLTTVAALNAKLRLPRLFRPTPNPPYTPLVNRISLNYKAESTINFEQLASSAESPYKEKLYHLHPFGFESLSPAHHRLINLVPQYESDGSLHIGMSGKPCTGILTLLFHLREDSIPDTAPPRVTWYYLSSNQWKRLDQSRVISDTTNGFISSGIVTLNIPEDVNRDNTIMPGKTYWLRVCVNNHPEKLSSAYSVYAQALRVTWQSGAHASSHLEKRLPAGTIQAPRVSIPGIVAITQVVDSFGGRVQESGDLLKTRISERLKHKNRATTPWDYERLILDRFPEIAKVKCFSTMTSDPNRDKHVLAGHVLIAVIPFLRERESANPRPMVDGLFLEKIKDFVTHLASPFTEIEVRNPAYEQIQVRCTVRFTKGRADGYSINRLNRDISEYLSPWTKTGCRAQFGWRIRLHDIESHIRDLDYVDFLTKFSMLHITDDGEGYFRLFDTMNRTSHEEEQTEISPFYPWSIAIPATRHFIETTDRLEPIAAEITGIEHLEIGSTFILP